MALRLPALTNTGPLFLCPSKAFSLKPSIWSRQSRSIVSVSLQRSVSVLSISVAPLNPWSFSFQEQKRGFAEKRDLLQDGLQDWRAKLKMLEAKDPNKLSLDDQLDLRELRELQSVELAKSQPKPKIELKRGPLKSDYETMGIHIKKPEKFSPEERKEHAKACRYFWLTKTHFPFFQTTEDPPILPSKETIEELKAKAEEEKKQHTQTYFKDIVLDFRLICKILDKRVSTNTVMTPTDLARAFDLVESEDHFSRIVKYVKYYSDSKFKILKSKPIDETFQTDTQTPLPPMIVTHALLAALRLGRPKLFFYEMFTSKSPLRIFFQDRAVYRNILHVLFMTCMHDTRFSDDQKKKATFSVFQSFSSRNSLFLADKTLRAIFDFYGTNPHQVGGRDVLAVISHYFQEYPFYKVLKEIGPQTPQTLVEEERKRIPFDRSLAYPFWILHFAVEGYLRELWKQSNFSLLLERYALYLSKRSELGFPSSKDENFYTVEFPTDLRIKILLSFLSDEGEAQKNQQQISTLWSGLKDQPDLETVLEPIRTETAESDPLFENLQSWIEKNDPQSKDRFTSIFSKP